MSAILPIYAPAPVAPVCGEGIWLYEAEGDAWLDCIGGVATNALGHCHPALVTALTRQAHKLWHVSNALRIPAQETLAGALTRLCFADKAFFCNTGTEAVETALKMARKHHAARGDTARIDIIGFAGSFHGRTYAALNAAGQAAYLDGFGPRMAGFLQHDITRRDAIAKAIASPTTAAVIVEPVQGEGGARALEGDFLLWLRKECSAHGVLLIHDEVQSGMGRTGQLFAHQWFPGAEPDIMAIAKALGAGFPVGACLASDHAASGMGPASHGSTFGGNPLAMAVASAALDIIADPATLAHVRAVAGRLHDGLARLAADYPALIVETRGKGLLAGLKLAVNNRAFMARARDQRLLLSGGGDNIVRMLPSLLIAAQEVDMLLDRLRATCAAITAQPIAA
jgi:acetylornithine/N-succinyldiaminopimelate aminotransferase